MIYSVFLVIFLVGCSTTSFEKKQMEILKCVKDLQVEASSTVDAFEVCRQVYRLKKIKE